MTAELEESLTGLPNVQDSDDVRVLSEGGQEVGIMW